MEIGLQTHTGDNVSGLEATSREMGKGDGVSEKLAKIQGER